MTRPRAARPPMSALAMLQQEVNELFQRLSILDRSVTKGILHRNTAARHKSRLTRQVNALGGGR